MNMYINIINITLIHFTIAYYSNLELRHGNETSDNDCACEDLLLSAPVCTDEKTNTPVLTSHLLVNYFRKAVLIYSIGFLLNLQKNALNLCI